MSSELSPEEEALQIDLCITVLRNNPEKIGVLFWFTTRDAAADYARRINMGLNDLLDPAVYWADPGKAQAGKVPLLIGLHKHMPEEWRKFITSE